MIEDPRTRIGNAQTCPVAVMINDGKMLIGRRHYPDKTVWTAPGGRCEPGETLEATLRREVLEEVGITDFKIQACMGEVPGAKAGDTVPLFLCTTEQDAILMEPDKFSEWRWVTVDEYIGSEEYSGFNLHARKMIDEYF